MGKSIASTIYGVIFGIILAILPIILLSNSYQKKDNSSYYEKLSFDFIVPKPWYSQIQELKALSFIQNAVPYYMTSRKVSFNGKNADVDLYLIEKDANIDVTPFSSNVLLAGEKLTSNGIIIDERVRNLLNIGINDGVQISFGSENINFPVKGVVYQNQFATRPTAAVFYSGKVKSNIEQTVEHFSYSGAYIKAENIADTENYLNKNYRALGRVGERSWYKTESAYNYMKESIERTSVAKEIINVAQIKASVKSNSAEASKSYHKHLLFSTSTVFALPILFWLMILLASSKSYRKEMKNGKAMRKVIAGFYVSEILSLVVFILVLIVFKNMLQTTALITLFISAVISFILVMKSTSKIISRSNSKVENRIIITEDTAIVDAVSVEYSDKE